MSEQYVAEYFCEGCGVLVKAFGWMAPPSNHFCMTCTFLSFFKADPDQFWQVYKWMHKHA
jgi:hypothetical protein